LEQFIFIYLCMPLHGCRRLTSGASAGAGTQPVVLLGCGSFSPVTYLHLRMFGTMIVAAFSGGMTKEGVARSAGARRSSCKAWSVGLTTSAGVAF
jgi:hypothetical protein